MSSSFSLNDAELVSVFDELPLWSAPFGMTLLDQVDMKSNMRVLDIGCGTGFPCLELAQRLGNGCHVVGIDPWTAAINCLKQKIRIMGVANLEAIEGTAEHMPFADGEFDLIVSNNGLNNVQHPEQALAECRRIARPGAQIVMTVNLFDSMKEFYAIFEATLNETGRSALVSKLRSHRLAKRRPVEEWRSMLERAGFRIKAEIEDSFRMRFLDGTAFFRHFFIRLGFMDSWREILPEKEAGQFFTILEEAVNRYASLKGELSLTIPYICINSSVNPDR